MIYRASEVGDEDYNLTVSPFGEQEWLATEKGAEKGGAWHPAHRQTLDIPAGRPPLSLLFEELETLSLLNPVGEQGGFSHTYFYNMDVQTGSQRELAFHSLYF